MTAYDYFEKIVFEVFEVNINLNDSIGETFQRFYKYLDQFMKKNGPFAKSISDITKHFNNVLSLGEEIIIISKSKDSSNLTYFKTITKHFDFIII